MQVIMRLAFFVLIFSASFSYAEELSTSGNQAISVQYFSLQQANRLAIHDVLALEQEAWQALTANNIRVSDKPNWLAIKMTNHARQAQQFKLVLSPGDNIVNQSFFIQTAESNVSSLVSERRFNGLVDSELTLPPEQQSTVYIALSSSIPATLSIELMSLLQFDQYLNAQYLSFGLAIGAMLALTLILVIVAFANQQRIIWLLASYYLLQSFVLAVFYGVNLLSVIPDFTLLHGVELPILVSLSAIALLGFASELTNLANRWPRLHRVFQASAWLLTVNIALSFLLPVSVNWLLCQIINIAQIFLLAMLAKNLLQMADKLAKGFTLFVALLALTVASNLLLVGWLEFDAIVYTFGIFASALVIVYLLARQSALQISAKYSAQRAALESEMQSKLAREELIELQARTQEQLESRVQERTLELNIALQELEEANRELAQKNTLDELTGLYNRRYYDQKMLAEFRRSRRNLTPLSLVIIDIDYFKKINDTYGHSAGDTCLVILAKVIKQSMRRSTDTACRYGGEEFCLILPETDQLGAMALANELRVKVTEQVFDLVTEKLSLTISCGVTSYQQQAQAQPVDIFNAADKALYQAKKNGRNQVANQEIMSSDSIAHEENE